MAKYTTGELARLCGITVRTVQYYDNRGILSPSEVSEGGRRIYSEEDLKKMKTICVLRDLGLPLKTIGELMAHESPETIIDYYLTEQQTMLQKDIDRLQQTLSKLERLQKELHHLDKSAFESIDDISIKLRGSKKLHRLYAIIFATGIPLNLLQWAGILWWIFNDSWQLFALWAVIALPYGIWMVHYYISNVSYICPHCHQVFNPSFKEAFFAKHTRGLRQLTCTHCAQKDFCIEIYREEEE